MEKILEFEKILGYEFKDKHLLRKALTHSSYANYHGLGHAANNQRLEFLGDAFLDAIIGAELYESIEAGDEGTLTTRRANLVCEKMVARVARKVSLGDFLLLGKNEAANGISAYDSVLADAMEAVIGAMYLDAGFEKTKEVILMHYEDFLNTEVENESLNTQTENYKGLLQETVQAERKNVVIKYILDKTEGPAHQSTFYMHVEIDGVPYGKGVGDSKRKASQEAAKETLKQLK